ncbi:MAG: YqeG family HAD IIIA-type phosphatase [Acholeplasmataceae bacterium]|nr:MAG: YqeG family HAD IIIA-type phosphatase [Acholeplasmataceae bacterium]
MAFYQQCIPDAYAASIFEIPYDTLTAQGIHTLLFDLDNTIISYDQEVLDDRHVDLLARLKETFKIVIISNSGHRRVSKALAPLEPHGIPYVWHAKKPFKSGFKKALRLVGATREETLVIGDQMMTDVLGGKRTGLKVLLVGSVKRTSDHAITRFNRRLEARVLKTIKKKEPALYESRLKAYVDSH